MAAVTQEYLVELYEYKVNRLRLTLSLTLTQNRNLKCAARAPLAPWGVGVVSLEAWEGAAAPGRRATKRGGVVMHRSKASASASASALQ